MTLFIDRAEISVPTSAALRSGFLNAEAKIARSGIQIYHGSELTGVDGVDPEKLYRVYRPDAEVFATEAMDSFANLPVTDGHPPEGVDVDNHSCVAIGVALGEVAREGDFLTATLSIRDAATIEKLKRGEAHQISTGYYADVTLAPGTTPDGETYDAIQSHIRGNHIALVDAARCGPECRIGIIADCDCASCQTKKGHTMSDGKISFQDEGDPVSETVEALKAANTRLTEALEAAQETIARLMAELESKSGEVEAMSAGPTSDADLSARIHERADLLTHARAILGHRDFSGHSNADIRRAALAKSYGEAFIADASDHALSGMFKVLMRDQDRFADNLNGAVSPSSHITSLDAARAKQKARLANAWKEGRP